MEEKFWHAEGHGEGKNLPYQTKEDLSSTSAKPGFAGFNLARAITKSTFGKAEKLKSQKTIEQLFNEGKSVTHNGFTLVYLFAPLNTPYPAQASFSVPKKFFKSAVHRNRIKRLMREAYRLNKAGLYQKLVERKQQVALMWVYRGREVPSLPKTTEAILKLAGKL